MIICSCNVLSDDDVRGALANNRQQPCTPGQVYACFGCSAQCGRCARTIKRIVDDALRACSASCTACPVSPDQSVPCIFFTRSPPVTAWEAPSAKAHKGSPAETATLLEQ